MNRKNKNGKSIEKENSFLPREDEIKRGDAKEKKESKKKGNKRKE